MSREQGWWARKPRQQAVGSGRAPGPGVTSGLGLALIRTLPGLPSARETHLRSSEAAGRWTQDALMAGGGLGGGQEKGGWFARRLRAPLRVQGISGPWTRSPRGLCLHGRGSEACSETPSPGVLPVATAPVKSLHWPRITDHSRSFIKTVILTHTHTHTHTHTNTNTLHPPVRLFCISTSPCGDTPHPQTRGSQRTSADSKPKGTGSVISWTGFAGGGA